MSKIIFKMSFKHPNLKDTASKNMSHVEYIATRPGTDKTITEGDLKKELEKGIESLSSDDTYVQYIDERPRSHGLFGQDGIEDPNYIKKEMSEAKSFVWRGIVSLREDDAKELGYLNKDQWQDMLRKKIPDMASEMGIPITNLRWVGAVHMEKGHPHAHIMLWEKEPQRTVGVVSNKTIDNIRKMFTDEVFEEERFQLMNERTVMRELINDLAKNDISKVTQLIKEVRATGQELNTFIDGLNQEGVTPKLYSEEERQLAEMVNKLADKLPGKGRVALKFMPEDIKDEVRAIADYLLQQPEMAASLAKNLNAMEELTKMYTGKDDAIEKARNNAYNDIRDRVCQVILKGAVESQRDNIFYIDQELSQKAIEFIKGMNNQIYLIPEQRKVLTEIAIVLKRTNLEDEEVFRVLKDLVNNENINYPDDSIKSIINQINKGLYSENKSLLLSSKKVDYYLSILKLSGAIEKDSFKHIKNFIKEDSKILDNRLQKLEDIGLLRKEEEYYKLTNKGVDEILKIKDLDMAEKEILKMLEPLEMEEIKNVNFDELLNNKSIFESLYDKDLEEVKISKFDTKVREEFGEFNKITLKQLEANIYEKYTDDELNTNMDKAEREFDILKNRIQKLTLNGFIELDKITGIYSFTEESNQYFIFDEKKDTYVLTEEAIDKFNIPKEMEFTRYDANVTLSYIDKATEGVLTADNLRATLQYEITNQTAQNYYNRFTELINADEYELTSKYISINQEGNLSSTEEGKWLGINLNKLNKYFKEAEGPLTDSILKELCSTDQEYQNILKQFEKQIEKGHIEKDEETGIYRINSTISDINNLLYQIYKEGGSINKENLKEILEKNIPNYEAEKQFKYLTWRLDNLKEQGYLKGQEKEYQLTLNGIEKRADILIPERNLLRGTLRYLGRLGLITPTDEGYQITEKYYKYMKNIAISKEENTTRSSNYITKDIYELIDRTHDKINVDKIERNNERIATGKYINGEYEEIKTSYEDIRVACSVPDTIEKTVNKLSTTLLVSGVNLESTKKILNEWNIRSNSNIDPDKLNSVIDKAHKTVTDNNLWGKTTIISTKEWKLMFESLGIQEENIPKWIYKGENWKSFNNNMGLAIINDIWKSTWGVLEKQRLQTESQAEYMKKQLNKQQSMNQSKEAIKEQIRKSKDRGSLYRDDELEL